jgi:hypothetical protein
VGKGERKVSGIARGPCDSGGLPLDQYLALLPVQSSQPRNATLLTISTLCKETFLFA